MSEAADKIRPPEQAGISFSETKKQLRRFEPHAPRRRRTTGVTVLDPSAGF
jgi:hypothetical protein